GVGRCSRCGWRWARRVAVPPSVGCGQRVCVISGDWKSVVAAVSGDGTVRVEKALSSVARLDSRWRLSLRKQWRRTGVALPNRKSVVAVVSGDRAMKRIEKALSSVARLDSRWRLSLREQWRRTGVALPNRKSVVAAVSGNGAVRVEKALSSVARLDSRWRLSLREQWLSLREQRLSLR